MKMDQKDVHNSIGYLTGKVHRALREVISQELGLRGVQISAAHIPVLGFLAMRKGGPVGQREVSDFLEFDRHRTSRAVKELQESGWLDTEPNPENRRENMIQTTERGRELCFIIKESAAAAITRAYKGCTQEQIQVTEHTLKQILNNLSDYEH